MTHPLYYFGFLVACLWFSFILVGFLVTVYDNSRRPQSERVRFILADSALLYTIFSVSYLITYVKYH